MPKNMLFRIQKGDHFHACQRKDLIKSSFPAPNYTLERLSFMFCHRVLYNINTDDDDHTDSSCHFCVSL